MALKAAGAQPPSENAVSELSLHLIALNSTFLSRTLTGLQEVGCKLYEVCPVNQDRKGPAAALEHPEKSAKAGHSTVNVGGIWGTA